MPPMLIRSWYIFFIYRFGLSEFGLCLCPSKLPKLVLKCKFFFLEVEDFEFLIHGFGYRCSYDLITQPTRTLSWVRFCFGLDRVNFLDPITQLTNSYIPVLLELFLVPSNSWITPFEIFPLQTKMWDSTSVGEENETPFIRVWNLSLKDAL